MRDIPFNYITQKDFDLCKMMDGTFCSRTSFFIFTTTLYSIYGSVCKYLALPVKNALQDSPYKFIDGAVIGLIISVTSILLNILSGFIEITDIDYKKIWFIPAIIIGMLFTGTTEEILYRALPINALRPYISENILVPITALLFGYVHSGNSLYYGLTTTITGLLLGYGFLKYGLYWAIGLHSKFNMLETSFYTVFKYKVNNKLMAGERSTPDDDGLMSGLIELAVLIGLKSSGYL
jgi:membrane protease YdiL (CAAX protease family)